MKRWIQDQGGDEQLRGAEPLQEPASPWPGAVLCCWSLRMWMFGSSESFADWGVDVKRPFAGSGA